MSYWTDRMERADSRLDKDEATLDRLMRRFYEKELKALQKDIAEFYARYGEDGVLRYRTMLRDMDQADFDLLMRDCEEFARQHPELADMVEIRKDIYRLDRMEGLQAYARLHLAQAAAESADGLDDHFSEAARRAQRAVAEAMGHGESYNIYDDQAIRQFVGQPWSDGQSYSERIWSDTEKVAQYVQKDLVDALIRGDSYDRLAKQMRKRFGQSEYNVMRVVRTEGTYVARQAQGAAMREQGIDTYYIDAVGDERTCAECGHADRDSHSEPYTFDGAVVGENYPPLHPNCRCQVNPGVADWDEWLRQRRAERRGVSAKVAGHPDEPTFEPAKTKKAATEYLKSFGFKKVSPAFTLSELNQMGQAFTKVFARFPFLKGFDAEISARKLGGGAVAAHSVKFAMNNGKSVAQPSFKFDRGESKAIERYTERCCKVSEKTGTRWWTQKQGFDGLVMHEATHAVEAYLKLKVNGITAGEPMSIAKRVEVLRNWREVSEEVCREAFSRLGIPYTSENVRKHISEYGATNSSEALAEAVSCEDETDEVCNAVKTVLNEKIKEIENATGTTD